MNEALELVRGARLDLERADESLDSARNWGIFDMLGGGLISTLVKHSRMNGAEDCIASARRKLERAGKILRAANPSVDTGVNDDGLLKFADIFFDGILADALMQGRIAARREQVRALLDKTRAFENALRSGRF